LRSWTRIAWRSVAVDRLDMGSLEDVLVGWIRKAVTQHLKQLDYVDNLAIAGFGSGWPGTIAGGWFVLSPDK
jgi:hypothetical protein